MAIARVLAALLTATLTVVAAPPADNGAKPVKAQPKGHFTIGKATTYVTGPLDKDGRIDYATALNERMSKGVTPEDNANVLLWKVLGPEPEGAPVSAEYFKWLGMTAPPPKGDYFVGLKAHARERLKALPDQTLDEFFNLQDRASKKPWAAKENPEIARWLAANEKPLALVREAVRRPKYFSPLFTNPRSGLVGALLPGVQKCRDMGAALACRAMLYAGEGKLDEAWQDVLACHRLGRHVGRDGTLIEGLVGIALERVAQAADLELLSSGKLDAKQLDTCLRDLRELPPLPNMADKVDRVERLVILDSVMMMYRDGDSEMRGEPDRKPTPEELERFRQAIDWDTVLTMVNEGYDRTAAAMRLPTHAERVREWKWMADDLRPLMKKAEVRRTGLDALFGRPDPKAAGRSVGATLVGLLQPSIQKVQESRDRVQQGFENITAAFALARYRLDHDRYPERLDALAPKYLPAVPGDLFTAKQLIYRRHDKGYLLYSVGLDGEDDEGRADDLAVRMPPDPEP